jgi:hypothetical protein
MIFSGIGIKDYFDFENVRTYVLTFSRLTRSLRERVRLRNQSQSCDLFLEAAVPDASPKIFVIIKKSPFLRSLPLLSVYLICVRAGRRNALRFFSSLFFAF